MKLPLFAAAAWLGLFRTSAIAQSLWFEPGVAITKFQVTMVVPAVSTGSGYHAVWPGLENDSGGFVFQNVVSDSNTPGSWQFWVEYCCDENFDSTPINVSPGDTIVTTFTYGSSGWKDSFSISGSTSQSGSYTEDFTSEGILDKALLAIELQNGASWDFGQVQWKNVVIATTTTASWCSTGYVSEGSLSYTISSSSSSTSGSTTTCSYSSVLFKGT